MTRPIRTHSARIGVSALAAAAGLLATGAVTASPARSATPADPSCPTVAPVSGLAAGQPVTGLTVTSGTTPSEFTGSIQGVLEDGIAPGVDMILATLDSTTINRVGIWSGMSGSPVYDADGDLIGAVSYSLGTGPSSIAGITPAADMAALSGAPARVRARAARVQLPASVARRLVRAKVASPSAVAQGLTQLRVPVTVSGLTSARMAKVAPVLRLGGGHVTAGTAGVTSSESIPITAGGNMAASEAYGTVTAAGVGTATTVCAGRVTGFGHPMDFSGPSTLTLHGARAVTIQDDPTVSGFKVANLGAPVGAVTQDRMAGLLATIGAAPATSPLTATATEGARSFTGTTQVSVPGLMPDLGFAHLIAVQDKVLDRFGKGQARTSWTIAGTRKSGAPFSMTHKNLIADPEDISASTAIGLASDLYAIQENPDEVVKINSVKVTSALDPTYEAYAIAKVQVQVARRWVTAKEDQPLPLRAGRVAKLRVFLTSREGAPRTLAMQVHVPPRATGKLGYLRVQGGQPDEWSEDFFEEDEDAFESLSAPSSASFPKLLTALAAEKNNQVVATVRFRRAPGTAKVPRTTTLSTDRVVSGDGVFPVVAVK